MHPIKYPKKDTPKRTPQNGHPKRTPQKGHPKKVAPKRTTQINQLKQQQNQEKPSYDTKQIAALLQRIFQNIESMDKAQLKALYLTVIDRIDIRKDGNHKKQFYVTLKLNNEIIKQLFNDTPLDEVLLSTSSLFLPQTLFLQI